MSSEQSALLGLPYIQAAQAQKHITHNEALRLLDVLVQATVIDRDRTAPPGNSTAGDRHLVAAGAGGAWVGQDGALALYETETWIFHAPRPGWRVHVLAEGTTVVFDGADWIGGIATGTDRLGINTGADEVNRLVVSASATLLTHDGAGHQLKLNKAEEGDTATLLFQTGFSGRAEMGCAGEDAFSIKVSADGDTWTRALAFDPATGAASGNAVQQDATDTSAGRLALAEHVFGPGNLLGPVSEAAGVPTGSVIERGSNADGSYVRFADGTQVCTSPPIATAITDAIGGLHRSPALEWTFPAAFADTADGGCFVQGRVLAAGGLSVAAPGSDATDRATGIRAYAVASIAATKVQLCAIGRWT